MSPTHNEVAPSGASPTPWLSILVPVYNVGAYVDECVASIMRQWIDGVEVLMLDDASSDDSGMRIHALSRQYPGRIGLLHHARNRGLSAARNSLLAQATGSHVWFLDSDDLLCAGALGDLQEILLAHDPDLVLCDFKMMRARSGPKHWLRGEGHRYSFAGRRRRLLTDRPDLVVGLLMASQLHAWSKIARRQIWLQAPFPEGRYFEDIAVIPDLLQAADSVYYEPTAWVAYRQRADSIVQTFSVQKVRDLLMSLEQLHGGMQEKFPTMVPAAQFALDQFCLKGVTASARRACRVGAARQPELQAMYRASLSRMFPQGVEAVLAQYRRRGWMLRAARAEKTLKRTGIISAMDPSGPKCIAGDPQPSPVRVLHFVTGGFSGGATQVAIQLVNAARESEAIEPLLVLRRKRHADPGRIAELVAAGLPVQQVAGWSHLATIAALVRVCRAFKPEVLVAHGFSEHLWGRYAGLLAGAPHLVHVEHNTRERYTRWRLAQTRWLARRTDRIVGCSEGVRRVLLDMGMPPERTIAIANGIRVEPFADADAHPYAQRTPAIVMVARFSKQKDHLTLLHALALLRARGLTPPLLLAGGGKARHRAPLEALVRQLGIGDQVQFLGIHRDVPGLLMRHQLCVLSTHHEGMPLALIEGMAAGCAVIGSAVPGVREVIRDGIDGRLVPEADPLALADVLQALLDDPAAAAQLGAAARDKALHDYSRSRMNQAYEALFLGLADRGSRHE